MLDILIKNALVMDGTGTPARKTDVTIKDGKIEWLGHTEQTAAETIDAEGLLVTPGFIDTHGHSDLFAFVDPDRDSKLCQGITTEICGQCGMGPAPVSGEFYAQYEGYYKSQGAPICPGSREFNTFGAYLNYTETLALGINMVYFIPHGTVRMAVMGLSSQKPTAVQIERMRDLVREGMENGALGLSSGLMYAPGLFADEDELTALCEIVGEYGGIYTSHLRDQGKRLEECVAETIRVAQNAKACANISHHKASGKENWGKVASTIRMIHDADISVMHDVYPYAASSTTLLSTLPHYMQKMTKPDMIAYLGDTRNRGVLKEAIFNPAADFESPLYDCGYDGIMIFEAAITKDAIGKTIEGYGRDKGMDPFDAFLKVLIDNELSAGYIGFSMSEKDVETLIADPLCMFGTDALYFHGMPMTHPRAIGTFPRILGRYVRERRLISLEEAIRKMTSLPAQFYGLKNKGVLLPGKDADIVIMKSDEVIDHADYQHPLSANEGLRYVIVNGKIAVKDDKALGIRNGRTLRVSRHG